MNQKKTFKVLAPISRKDGSTYWMRVGTAYVNKDDSINAFVDAFPREGKLQLRELDEEELRKLSGTRDKPAGEPRASGGSSSGSGSGSSQTQLAADAVPF